MVCIIRRISASQPPRLSDETPSISSCPLLTLEFDVDVAALNFGVEEGLCLVIRSFSFKLQLLTTTLQPTP